MRVLIVYESLFGNTHQVAEAIAGGITAADPAAQVDCRPVRDAGSDVAGYDLVVVGGPTHMRGMTSGFSRGMGLKSEAKSGEAAAAGHPPEPGAEGPGVRDWLHRLPQVAAGQRGAAFDTRIDARLAGGAAPGIAGRLRHHGFEVVAPPEGFIVEDGAGPLRAGEAERAAAWGAGLVRQPVG